MSEIQEIPISETGAIDTSLSLIKNVPNAKDMQANLIALRNEHGYSSDGIWSDARLQTAAQGTEIYAKIYNEASEQLKKYLDDLNIIQAFTGVRPIVQLGGQNPKTMLVESHFYHNGVRDTLFPQVREEFQRLLGTHAREKIRLKRVDYRNVQYVNTYRFELMNVSAISNIANENPGLFPDAASPSEWLLQNPGAWPMLPNSSTDEERIKEIRSGVLSGFPRTASEKYAEEATSGIDWKQTLTKLIKRPKGEDFFTRKVEHSPLRTHEVAEAVSESGLPFVHYSESDLKWTKDAAALAKHSIGLLRQVSKK